MASAFVEFPKTFGAKLTYKLAHGGYTYSQRCVSSDKKTKYYYCDQRRICNASIICRNGEWSYGKGSWEPSGIHTNHQPQKDRVVAEIVRGKAKNMSRRDPLLTPQQVLDRVVHSAPPDCHTFLPNERALRQCLTRARESAYRFPEPRTTVNISIPKLCMQTSRKKDFLLYDSKGENRTLIFSTVDNLKELSRKSVWILDGTFKASPKVYGGKGQLYTIHAYYQQTHDDGEPRACSIPLVYALLPNKKQTTYLNLFSQIKQISPFTLNPGMCIIDFEKASINAFQRSFPQADIGGCWFHLNQSVFRKVQSLGLQTKYCTNKKFRHRVKLLSALAFVPPKDVARRFQRLKVTFPADMSDLVEYFESTYIGTHSRQPLFNIELWNVYDRVYKKIPRTSNLIEGWHYYLGMKMQLAKPPLWKFIFVISLEQNRTENKLKQMSENVLLPIRKRRYREINIKVRNLCKKYRLETKTPREFHKWLKQFITSIPTLSI